MLMRLTLNDMVKKQKRKKVIITGDYHIPFLDLKAYEILKEFLIDYQPDYFFINGDFVDFYTLSDFSRNPKRSKKLKDEIIIAQRIITDLVTVLPKKCIKVFIEGNHCSRLQRYIWRNEELFGLESLSIKNLLKLDELGFEYVETDMDYWSSKRGLYELGNVLIMHGDSRLNGSSYSKYSGYSAKNTMYGMQSSIIMNHTHRLAQVYSTNPKEIIFGAEAGCLCMTTNSNWQQGFITFNLIAEKAHSIKLHHIQDGNLITTNKWYRSTTKDSLIHEFT